jgi:hypothetical protein
MQSMPCRTTHPEALTLKPFGSATHTDSGSSRGTECVESVSVWAHTRAPTCPRHPPTGPQNATLKSMLLLCVPRPCWVPATDMPLEAALCEQHMQVHTPRTPAAALPVETHTCTDTYPGPHHSEQGGGWSTQHTPGGAQNTCARDVPLAVHT